MWLLLVAAALLAPLVALAIAVRRPAVVPEKLEGMPSLPYLYLQVLRSACTKPKFPKGQIKPGKRITVSLTQRLPFDQQRYAGFLALMGYDGVPHEVPLSYPIVEAFRLSMLALCAPAFPFNVLGSVLARNTTSVSRALTEGEELLYSTTIEPNYVVNDKGDVEVLVVTTGRDTSGAEVWRNLLTVIVINPYRQRGSGKAANGAAQQPAAAEQQQGAGKGKKPAPPEAPQRQIAKLKLADNVGRRYGALSGDRNLIHLHPLLARLFGFKRHIAHALYIVGRLESALVDAGITPHYPAVLETEFKRPTPLPATLLATASSTSSYDGTACKVLTSDGAKEVIVGHLTSLKR